MSDGLTVALQVPSQQTPAFGQSVRTAGTKALLGSQRVQPGARRHLRVTAAVPQLGRPAPTAATTAWTASAAAATAAGHAALVPVQLGLELEQPPCGWAGSGAPAAVAGRVSQKQQDFEAL